MEKHLLLDLMHQEQTISHQLQERLKSTIPTLQTYQKKPKSKKLGWGSTIHAAWFFKFAGEQVRLEG
jgi:hypothetical protein